MIVELLAEYGLFFAKILTFVVAIILVIGAIANLSHRHVSDEGHLQIKKINEQLTDMEHAMRVSIMDDPALKQYDKEQKKESKEKHKAEKKLAKSNTASDGAKESEPKKNIYVIDFDGDMKASEVDLLREEITAILTMAQKHDEIVVRLESPGGMVHAYGLASSQLARIKSAGIPLTICVDKVAASGGYMMACIADKILAAPFAVIGSIGVVASLPNFNKVLKKYDVDYELLTAGEYKRTLTMLGENTEEGRKKFVAELEETHELFKDFVSEYRPKLDIAKVATGETWYGKRALDMVLIDEVSTSDEYIVAQAKNNAVYEVKFVHKKNWQEKFGFNVQAAIENSIDKTLNRVLNNWNNKH